MLTTCTAQKTDPVFQNKNAHLGWPGIGNAHPARAQRAHAHQGGVPDVAVRASTPIPPAVPLLVRPLFVCYIQVEQGIRAAAQRILAIIKTHF